MEVASPLPLGPSPNHKRGCGSTSMLSAEEERRKRRRFLTPSEVDSLSAEFSSQSLLYKSLPVVSQGGVFSPNGAASSFINNIKRARNAAASSSEVPAVDPAKHEALERVVQEQALLIESLQSDKAGLEKSLSSLQSDMERLTKDNGILRKAVTIQEERRVAAEQEAQQFQERTQDHIQGLEQMIRTLRYHLQAAHATVGNDFMQPRPPDVY